MRSVEEMVLRGGDREVEEGGGDEVEDKTEEATMR